MTNATKPKILLVEGPERFDPLAGLKKLWGGFCDPSMVVQQVSSSSSSSSALSSSAGGTTSTTANSDDKVHGANTAAQPQRKAQVQREEGNLPKENNHQTQPLNNNTTTKQQQQQQIKRGIQFQNNNQTHHDTTTPSTATIVPELKSSNAGRKHRVVRGLGVGVFGVLAVLLTLWILHRSGYQVANLSIQGTMSSSFSSSSTTTSSSSSSSNSKESQWRHPIIKVKYNHVKDSPPLIPSKLDEEAVTTTATAMVSESPEISQQQQQEQQDQIQQQEYVKDDEEENKDGVDNDNVPTVEVVNDETDKEPSKGEIDRSQNTPGLEMEDDAESDSQSNDSAVVGDEEDFGDSESDSLVKEEELAAESVPHATESAEADVQNELEHDNVENTASRETVHDEIKKVDNSANREDTVLPDDTVASETKQNNELVQDEEKDAKARKLIDDLKHFVRTEITSNPEL